MGHQLRFQRLLPRCHQKRGLHSANFMEGLLENPKGWQRWEHAKALQTSIKNQVHHQSSGSHLLHLPKKWIKYLRNLHQGSIQMMMDSRLGQDNSTMEICSS